MMKKYALLFSTIILLLASSIIVIFIENYLQSSGSDYIIKNLKFNILSYEIISDVDSFKIINPVMPWYLYLVASKKVKHGVFVLSLDVLIGHSFVAYINQYLEKLNLSFVVLNILSSGFWVYENDMSFKKSIISPFFIQTILAVIFMNTNRKN